MAEKSLITPITLCMMVKDESKLIREALLSVRPYVTDWVVMDTGSTDNTSDIIYSTMGIEKPGIVIKRPWKNYGESRTEALQLAFDNKQWDSHWIFLLDADETVEGFPSFSEGFLNEDNSYWVTVKYGNITYARPNLISPKQDWRFVGVTHEYLTAFDENMRPFMPPVILLPTVLTTNPERCTKSPDRTWEDIRALTEGLVQEPENHRYVFYLAQSYKDVGRIDEAIGHYERRMNMGGWYEEAAYAALQAARLKEQKYYPEDEIIGSYLRAYDMNPARCEALGDLAKYLRKANRFHLAYMVSKTASRMGDPRQLLFVDASYYKWKCLDEFSLAAYYTGNYHESLFACERLLKEGHLPTWEVARVEKNKDFAIQKIGGKI